MLPGGELTALLELLARLPLFLAPCKGHLDLPGLRPIQLEFDVYDDVEDQKYLMLYEMTNSVLFAFFAGNRAVLTGI